MSGGKAATLTFQKLSTQKDDLDKKLAKQQKRIQEAESEEQELREAINQLKLAKRNQGGVQADREQTKRTGKEIYLLEQEKQRLLLASDKIDDQMRALREKINAARLDRLSRNRTFDALRHELDNVKDDLVAQIEHSNAVVEEKEQLDKAHEVHIRASEDSIIEFEACYQGLMQELSELQERYSSQFKSKSSMLDGPVTVEEGMLKMKLRVAQLDDSIAESKAFVTESDRKIKELGDVFQMMMVKQNVPTLDGLVSAFRDSEVRKFKTYSYIQHVNREIKTEERALSDLRRQIAEYRVTEGEDSKDREERMASYEQELNSISESSALNNMQQERYLAIIREIVNLARRLVNSIDSSTATIETESSKIRDDFTKGLDMLDLSEFVSEESMTKCLAMVEERAKRALRIFADLMKTSVGRAAAGAFAQTRVSLSRSGAFTNGAPPSPTPHDVARVLRDAGKGPVHPKTDSPLGLTRVPNFAKSALMDVDEDMVPDERPMGRDELFLLAQQEIGSGDTLLDSSLASQQRSSGVRSKPKLPTSKFTSNLKKPVARK